ncbi:MAG: DegT/DnrJ/EryC1/StrS family aminotransferase [Candidatus Bathyarchaeota archaeon]
MPNSEMLAINKIIVDIEEMRAVAQVLRSGMLTSKSGSGPNVMKFENAFANYVGTKYAVAMNSGTAALHATLLTADIGKGDEVIVPSLTFVATAEAVALTEAKPVFVDINPETYCIDPSEIEMAITSRTKAIIPVHLYGLPANMDQIMDQAKENNLVVIEDAAQAHGAKQGEKFTGNLGDMACFSFYGGKNMMTGEGGMVTTNSRSYYEVLRAVRNHGESKEYESVMLGHNYRMPEIEAAIGLVQLSKLPRFLLARRKNAKILAEMLEGIDEIQLPVTNSSSEHAWYVFTVRLLGVNASKRNKIVERIRGRHVDARVYYPKPIHLFQYYQKRFGSFKLPKTETAARQIFSLPVHPGLSVRDLRQIANAVKSSLD